MTEVKDKALELKKTCLYDEHVALEAKMSPFGGYMMPIQYSSIIDEHNAVRKKSGLFDVSHMGEIAVKGPDAALFINYVFSNDIAYMLEGETMYGMLLLSNAGTIDDLLVYKCLDGKYMLVVNAANKDKDFEWLQNRKGRYDVEVIDESANWGQLALQGPESEKYLAAISELEGVKDLSFYKFKYFLYEGQEIVISRTGYTGEDGFEIYAPNELIIKLWRHFIKEGVTPCGLGCRDTLRFEAGMPLYGHELSPEISPVQAGLGMFCKVDEKDFIGKDMISEQKKHGVGKKIVGIELETNAVPREGYEVLNVEGEKIGHVTTGYHSISLDKSLCFALINSALSAKGTPLQVRIRRKVFPGKVVAKRFYKANYKK